jgi:WD40 repeat protein
VNCVCFSPDGRFALSGSQDETLKLWDVGTGQCFRTFKWHGANAVCFSPDGRFVLSGGYNHFLKLWDVVTGQCLHTFKSHDNCVTSVCFSPDGRFVLSGSDDKTLKLWDVERGQCLRTFERHSNEVKSVCFSPDGQFALSGSEDRTLKLWELDWEYNFPGWANWDEGAKPYLEVFLTLHCPYGSDGISRVGKPSWNGDDFKNLIKELQYRGYGWLRPEGVRKKLEEIAAKWQGPPPLPSI